jgi:hypothetical protein
MASRSLLAILPIRTSSEVVGIGRAIGSSVRQPGRAQVQQISKKLCAAGSGAERLRRRPQVSPFGRNWASLRAATGHFAGHFEGFPAGPRPATFFWRGTAPIPPVEKFA